MTHAFDFEFFVGACLQLVLRHKDLPSYQLHYLQMERELFPAPEQGNLRDDDDLRRRLGLVLARAIWRAAPNPQLAFACPTLPQPGRNDPCYCGSQKKFSDCCAPLQQNAPLQNVDLLGEVLRLLPRTQWKSLPGSRIDISRVEHAAGVWVERGELKDALALVEPWFAGDDAFVSRRELLFDLLLGLYSDLRKPRKKSQLLDRALRHGDRDLRSAALQRMSAMASDRNDFERAWALFDEAQRINPAAVSLSHLEVTLLLSQGREPEAKAAARKWIARLGRSRDPALQGLIGHLQTFARDGMQALLRLQAEQD